jgi:hypothetical protein
VGVIREVGWFRKFFLKYRAEKHNQNKSCISLPHADGCSKGTGTKEMFGCNRRLKIKSNFITLNYIQQKNALYIEISDY